MTVAHLLGNGQYWLVKLKFTNPGSGATMTKLNNFFQISNEKLRMRRLSDWIIFVGLLATLVLVYSLHKKKVADKELTEEVNQDFSDVASRMDPPAGKTTRWISTCYLWQSFPNPGPAKNGNIATVFSYNFSHINNENPLANLEPLLGQYGQLGLVADLFKVSSNVSFPYSFSSGKAGWILPGVRGP